MGDLETLGSNRPQCAAVGSNDAGTIQFCASRLFQFTNLPDDYAMAAATGPAMPAAKYGMLPVSEALEIVLRETDPLPPANVPLSEAHGRILVSDVVAVDPVPPFPASIKDGYAVVAADGLGDYSVEFDAYAGTAPPPLQPGTVAYIGTGGPVPEGADAVVQVEDTTPLHPGEGGKRRVHIGAKAKAGQDIRPVGCDMAAGEVVLPWGTLLRSAEIGILATVGAATLEVHARPLVAVLSTGDEVVDVASGPLGPGQIRDANRDMLLAASRGAGAEALDLGIARDREGSVEGAVEEALASGAAVLLTTGGVSMGDKDLVKGALESRGQVFFGKILMKPGKPLTFAKVPRGKGGGPPLLVFGLPGNPVSSLVTFYLFVVPALRKLQGWQDPGLRRIHVRTTAPLKLDPVRPEYHRAIATWRPPTTATATTTTVAAAAGAEEGAGEWSAVSTGGQLSSRLLSMASANVLLELPQAEGVLPAGTLVPALVIGEL